MSDDYYVSQYSGEEIDAAVGRAATGGALDKRIATFVNPNLLDNWYFGNPIDQRQGRIVKPNTTYYSDNQLTTSAGTTSAYVTAYRYTTGTASGVSYASFKLEDSDTAPTYYAAPENVVRGYTGAGYGIDRWKIAYNPDSLSLLVTDSGLKVGGSITTGLFLGQWFEDGFAKGLINRICTVSLLFSDETFVTGSGVFPEKDGVDATLINTNDVMVYFQYNASSQNKPCVVMVLKNASKAVFAAKLELGSQQTLAHQDADGNWVMNEIPDYGEQLARCQRYFFKIGDAVRYCSLGNGLARDGQFVSLTIPTPVTMRTVPGLVAIPAVFTFRHSDTVVSRGVNFYVDAFSQSSIMLKVQSQIDLTPGDAWEAFLGPNGSIMFSADL